MSAIILPDMDALLASLDFKGVLEQAIGQVFAAANIPTLTAAGLIQPDGTVKTTDFQTAIPRIEIKVTIGAGTKQNFALVNGVRFNTSYQAALKIRALSRPDPEGKGFHAQLRAPVFYVANLLPAFTNGPLSAGGLINHQVHQPITQTGTADVFKTSEGYEYSDQDFLIDFSALPSAFASLAMPTPNPNPNP